MEKRGGGGVEMPSPNIVYYFLKQIQYQIFYYNNGKKYLIMKYIEKSKTMLHLDYLQCL